MQKSVNFPFKENLETNFLPPAHLFNSERSNLRGKSFSEDINNYLKSPEEMEAEFNLIAQTETRDTLEAMVIISSETDEPLFASNNISLGLPDYMEENY